MSQSLSLIVIDRHLSYRPSMSIREIDVYIYFNHSIYF